MATIIDDITQSISTIPPLRLTSTVINLPADEDDFVAKYEANNAHLVNNLVPELNALKTQLNTTIGQMNTVAGETETNATTATNAVTNALSSANNKGNWSALAGALNIPASVNHNGSVWILNINLANVTLSEPTAINTDWTKVGFGQSDLDTKLSLSGGVMTGAITGLKETSVAMGANDIDMSLGNLFTKTISGATTLTISNVPASGVVGYFVLELTNAGSGTITWFSGVKWAGGLAPTLTASGKDILSFYSRDNGTTWNVLNIQKDVK